jgi:hypothetical protein
VPVLNADVHILQFISCLCKYFNFEVVQQILDADIIIIPIIGFKSNSEFLLENKNYNKPIVVIDFSEYGVHVLRNLNYYDVICNNSFYGFKTDSIAERIKLNVFATQVDDFLRLNLDNIKLYFKRELSKQTFEQKKLIFPFDVQPIDYCLASKYNDFEPDTKEIFLKRNISIAHIWGKSNSDRMALHGALMLEASKTRNFFHTLVSVEQYNEYIHREAGNKTGILLLHKNGYVEGERIDFRPILSNARTFIDLYGNGMKCFRNVEASYNCISIKQDYAQMKFTYDWVNNENCIMIPNKNNEHTIDVDNSIKIITDIIDMKSIYTADYLYDVYTKSCSTVKKYFLRNYVEDHILQALNLTLNLI